MTSPKRAFLAVVAGLAFASCQTITEEMPGAPTPPTNGGGGNTTPIPVVVVPVPVPVPSSAPAPEPTSAPPPSNPNPNPNPNPTPKPSAPPANPGNTGNTVRIGAKVYFVERNGQIVPESEGASEALVGDRVHLDATAKDAANLPTTTNGPPHWTYSDPSLVTITGSQGDWTPVMLVKRPGVMSVYVEADGVRSNTITISFR